MANDIVLVLDHGYVKLVDYNGTDDSALIAARMSTDSPTGVDQNKDDRLRTRLWKDEHVSPFEFPDLTYELQIPLVILRQLDRHRTIDYTTGDVTESVDETTRKYMSRNEFSGRYSVMPDLFYIPLETRVKGKDPNNKQSSSGLLPYETRKGFIKNIEKVTDLARLCYKDAIEHGVANELARFLLPQNQYTKIRIKGNLLNWFKMLKLRLPEDAQWEVRQYAKAIELFIKRHYPKSYAVFEEYTLKAKTLSGAEVEFVKDCIARLLVAGPSTSDTENQLRSLLKKLGGA